MNASPPAVAGPSSQVSSGQVRVRLRHAAPKELVLAGTPAGEALCALRYPGPEQVTPAVIAQVRGALPVAEFKALRGETNAMPGLLSDECYRYEHPSSRSSERQAVREPADA